MLEWPVSGGSHGSLENRLETFQVTCGRDIMWQKWWHVCLTTEPLSLSVWPRVREARSSFTCPRNSSIQILLGSWAANVPTQLGWDLSIIFTKQGAPFSEQEAVKTRFPSKRCKRMNVVTAVPFRSFVI